MGIERCQSCQIVLHISEKLHWKLLIFRLSIMLLTALTGILLIKLNYVQITI